VLLISPVSAEPRRQVLKSGGIRDVAIVGGDGAEWVASRHDCVVEDATNMRGMTTWRM